MPPGKTTFDVPVYQRLNNLLHRASQETSLYLALSFVVLGASALLYLGYTLLLGGDIGFPLDDSWIHQVLARSLARQGALSFNLGEPAAATTSFLWTAILALGYKAGVNPYLWAGLMGAVSLGLTGWATHRLSLLLFPHEPSLGMAAAVITLLEWHLVWAAFSGMETVLFAFLTLFLITLALSEGSFVLMGLVGGLATLARPEGGILFLGALGWRAARELSALFFRLPSVAMGREGAKLAFSSLKSKAMLYLRAFILWGVLVAPYLAYNYLVIGRPMPTTFYAKNAFYSSGLDPMVALAYLLGALKMVASGPFLLLLPGFVYGVFRWWRGLLVLPLTWALGLILLYLVWLPALYHHGRYLFPIIPIFILFGVMGTAQILRILPFYRLAKVVPFLAAFLTLALWGNGAIIYAWDVKFINDQDVAVAFWLRNNTPSDTLIATHDVGALGYFAQRPILDMAGLATPQLMASPRDFQKITGFMEEQGVSYIAIFPRWYPWITEEDPRFQEVYRVKEDYALRLGGDNMVVYKTLWRGTKD